MPYNLPQRKLPRAVWHDYNGGNYFVTFCTKNHELYFGDIVDGRMELSEIGKYAHYCVEKIPEINDSVLVPEFVVMPNHVHMIVVMANLPESTDDVRLPRWDSPTSPTGDGNPDGGLVGLPYHDSRNDIMPDCEDVSYYDSRWEINEEMQRRSNCCGRLSRIIGQNKSVVTKYANQNDISFAWQPRFHDHIIRKWTEMNHMPGISKTILCNGNWIGFIKNGDLHNAAAPMGQPYNPPKWVSSPRRSVGLSYHGCRKNVPQKMRNKKRGRNHPLFSSVL